MALSVDVGSFALDTALGSHAVTGVGFQPKAVIFFGATFSTAANAGIEPGGQFLGFATSPTERGAVSLFHANGSFSIGQRITADHCILSCTSGGSLDAFNTYAADLTSFDADGFTLDIEDAPPSGYMVAYLALGGADLVNAKVGSFTFNTATGAQAVTGVGFHPDCVLLAHNRSVGTLPLVASNNHLCYGIATGAGAVSLYHQENNANPTAVGQGQRSDAAIVTGTSAAIDGLATMQSLDADGFTLNWSDAPAGAYKCLYLALKGGQYKVGAETQRTTTGTKATTGVGFTPKALFLTGYNHTPLTTTKVDTARTSIGAGDGTGEAVVWTGGADNKTPAASVLEAQMFKTTKVYLTATEDALGTLTAEADISSLDSDGFTLNWTTADATAREFLYLAMGDDPAAGGGGGGHKNMMTLGVG